PQPPAAPPNVMGNPFVVLLPAHAALSAIALLIGPFQILAGPDRGRGWHRLRGRIYVICCLLSAPLGLVLAFGATTGPIATAGFGLLSIVWFAVTALGYRAAVERRFDAHRRWMIRSYALTFGAVTLRIYLAFAIATHLDFDTAYRAISFLSWIPNLIFAELLLQRSGSGPLKVF
ncbi:DUF2306 domain-containing protein, partial [Methylocapsa sp. S129]|uniref:DUF2306 domain-containing protein n=1 Tax=Methylocapsa sp. S129 TaxID=1641869 RepID=UPI00131D670A